LECSISTALAVPQPLTECVSLQTDGTTSTEQPATTDVLLLTT
jgi:hypothetical protein